MDTSPSSHVAPESGADTGASVTLTARPAVDRVLGVGRWPARRLLSAAVLFMVLVIAVQVLVGWQPGAAPTWSALTLGTLGLASLALSTFIPLPGHGAALDIGCTPCAAAGGMLAVAGSWLAASSAYAGGTAALGLALAGAALARRVTEPVTCEA